MTSDSKKKTLLFISHSPDFYGAERVLYFLVNSLSSDYDIHVAIPGRGMLNERLAEYPGIRVHTIDLPVFTKAPVALLGSLPLFVRYFFQLRSMLRQIKPDLLYANTIRNYITCLYAYMLGSPCVLHLHEKNAAMPAGRLLARIIGRYAERVIYASVHVGRSYEGLNAGLRTKGVIIHNGVQAETVKDADQGLPAMTIPKDSFPVLATAASLAPHKRPDDLIEAMGAVVRDYPHALLLIAGEGTYRRRLEEHIRRRDLRAHIVLTGYVTDIAALLDAADIVLCPFEGEGFGLVALEAMTRKKPVVAADSGALPEIVRDGRTGLLYPVGDIPALAGRVCQLAGSSELRTQLGQEGGIRAAQDFAGPLQTVQVRRVIEEVCAAGERRKRQGHA